MNHPRINSKNDVHVQGLEVTEGGEGGWDGPVESVTAQISAGKSESREKKGESQG
jgi:hypothetical protein